MGRKRGAASELSRLLNSAQQPLYLVDREQTLVFCNQACLDWAGQKPDDMLGRRCTYHTSPELSGAEAVAAALCPPPVAMTGQSTQAVASWVDDLGEIHRRRVRFLPIGTTPDTCIGVLGVVDDRELPADDQLPAAQSQDDPTSLHEQLGQLQRQVAARFRNQRLLGNSPLMRRVRQQVAVAADSQVAVLIVGPPGSGREHVARTIHYADPRYTERTLVPLACGTLGAEFMASTLNALRTAHPPGGDRVVGTLLLSDVDQLPDAAQASVAAVLDRGDLPMRIVATSRTRLLQLSGRGQWHNGLAAALSTIVIELPSLSDRREDLPLLAQALLEETNARGAKQLGGFTAEALDHLDAYPWPNNVAELAQAIAEAHRQAIGPLIEVKDLPARLKYAADADAHPRKPDLPIQLDDLLADVEREVIGRAMAQARNNKSKAAKLLGLTRPRLYRRLEELGLIEEDEPRPDQA